MTGSLTATVVVAGEHDRAAAGRQVLGPVGVQGLDPPVLGVGRGAREVEPPAAVGTLQHDGALEGLGAELVAVDLADRLEVDAVGGPGDDRGDAATVGQRPAYAVGEVGDPVDQHGGGGTGPVARARARRGYDDAGVVQRGEWGLSRSMALVY